MTEKPSTSVPRGGPSLKTIEGMPAMTPEMQKELHALEAMKDSEIDTSDTDAPDLSEEEGWVRGKFYIK